MVGGLALEVWCWFTTRVQARGERVGWRIRGNFIANYLVVNLWWLLIGVLFWRVGTPEAQASGAVVFLAISSVFVLLFYSAPMVFLAAGAAPAIGALSVIAINDGRDWRHLLPVWIALGLSMVFNLGRALDTLPEAIRVLNKNREHIVEAFGALKKLATVTSHVLAKTKVDFAADLKDLYSVVKALNDNRKNFVTSLQLLLTFPFPNFGIKQAVRGDYLNVFTTFDLTLRRLGETFFTTSYPFDPNMMHMSEILNPPDFLVGEQANLSGQAADPFKIPPGTASGQ